MTRGELLRSAANICRFVLQSPAMERELGIHDGTVEVIGLDKEAGQAIDFDVTYRHLENGESGSLSDADTSTGSTYVFAVSVDETGTYDVTITAKSDAEWVTQTKQVFFLNQHNYLQLYFALGGLDVKDITFTLVDSFSMKNG